MDSNGQLLESKAFILLLTPDPGDPVTRIILYLGARPQDIDGYALGKLSSDSLMVARAPEWFADYYRILQTEATRAGPLRALRHHGDHAARGI